MPEQKPTLLDELKQTSHTDFRAVRILMDLVLEAGGAIGLSNQELENLQNAVQSIIDQQGMLRDEVTQKLAALVLTEEKVKGYHDSVINQIGQLAGDIKAIDTRLKKLEPK